MMSYNNSGIGLPCAMRGGKSQYRAECGHEVGRVYIGRSKTTPSRTPAPSSHHPSGSRERIAGAVMLKSIATGIVVGVAAKIRQDEHRRIARIFRLALDGLPDVRAKAVGAANSVNVEGIRAGVRDIDVVHA